MCATLGVDPYATRLTIKELCWSLRAALRERWDHTALIASILHNTNSKKKVPWTKFNPYRVGEKTKKTGATLGDFKARLLGVKK